MSSASIAAQRRLSWLYRALYDRYGPQHWWPAETPFEVMVGAVLTQNTAWTNVEAAIANLKGARCLNADEILGCPHAALAQLIRPVGYFNIKSQRLKAFCAWYLAHGGYAALRARKTAELRIALLTVNGIGPETADDILLYAFQRPVFVIDAYTRRLLRRLGLLAGDEGYEAVRTMFEAALEPDAALFNEYHALIVHHVKNTCRRQPECARCCLVTACARAADGG
jgi:endonuclease-3 related protein